MSREDDRALRFYNEVLGLDHLHYGIWKEDDELTLTNLKTAQLRYEDFLLERIPAEAKLILDVGCGTSAMSQRMVSLGFTVQGLSPDQTQKENFVQNLNIPFHHCLFEDLQIDEKFDCLVMSESAQYIPIIRLFENAKRHLIPGGHILLCDYFVLDNANGLLAKSGHNYESFKTEAIKQGFLLIEEIDITDRVLKTLDVGLLLSQRILKGLEIVSEKSRKKHPWLTKIAFRIFRRKWLKLNEAKVLLDSNAFKAQKRYAYMLFQAPIADR